MSVKSILLVSNYSNKTGYAWNNIYRLFNYLSKEFHRRGIKICLSFSDVDGDIEFVEKEIPFEVIKFNPYHLDLKSIWALRKKIKKYNIKFVYFTDQKPLHWLYLILRLFGIKKIVIHCRVSVPDPKPAIPETGIKKIVKSSLSKIRLISADSVYAVSNFVKDRLVKKHCFPEERVFKILNGIDLNEFKGLQGKENSTYIKIFSSSRATKHKGIHVLIEAVRNIISKGHYVPFVVEYAGDGPDLDEFKNLVEKYNLNKFFKFLGELKNTIKYSNAADIIIVPSNWGDACPSSVIEALASGKAVITTRAGGIPEIIENEKNAIIISPGDVMALAEKLLLLINDSGKRAELGRNARQRAEEALNIQKYHQYVLDRMLLDLEI